MSVFLFKSILSRRNLSMTINPNAYQCALRLLSNEPNQDSFTVSYFINSLGFSQKAALSASKAVSFKTKEKPDKAIEFLRDYGFTQTQISKIVSSLPKILVADTQKTILPKLEFLESKGILIPELAGKLSLFPSYLKCSLSKTTMPSYEFFKSLSQSDEGVAKAITRQPGILVSKNVRLNIVTLQEHKVPDLNIATLLRRQPDCFLQTPDRFRKLVEEVAAMGFDPSKMHFVVALFALRSMTKTNWDSKVDLYKKWGWSHEDFLEAFRREPKCMLPSHRKISACMDFLTNQMGWDARSVVKRPLTILMSLEKRIIPRCLVYQLLQSKGLVKRAFGLSSLLSPSEKKFLNKFVMAYESEAPELLKFYEEKIKLSDGSSSEESD